MEIFTEVVLHGRQCGLPGSPVAFETHLPGNTSFGASSQVIGSHHVMLQTGEDLLRCFWEVENVAARTISPHKNLQSFQKYHTCYDDGRFWYCFPRRRGANHLESHSLKPCTGSCLSNALFTTRANSQKLRQ